MKSPFNQYHATHSFSARRIHEAGLTDEDLEEIIDSVCLKLEETLRGVCEYRTQESAYEGLNTDITITFLAPDSADDDYVERLLAHARNEIEHRIDEKRVKMEADD